MLQTVSPQTSQSSSLRPIPYVGDNLDRLLDLLDAARAEQHIRAATSPDAPYRTLATEIARSRRSSRRLRLVS